MLISYALRLDRAISAILSAGPVMSEQVTFNVGFNFLEDKIFVVGTFPAIVFIIVSKSFTTSFELPVNRDICPNTGFFKFLVVLATAKSSVSQYAINMKTIFIKSFRSILNNGLKIPAVFLISKIGLYIGNNMVCSIHRHVAEINQITWFTRFYSYACIRIRRTVMCMIAQIASPGIIRPKPVVCIRVFLP